MSRAFVKETDAELPPPPERPVSAHPNFVTAQGLAAIEAELARLDAAHAAAVRAGDREAIALTQRDQRYWTARRASAQVVGDPPADGRVHFGSTVTLERGDGRRQTFRIVGEDEPIRRKAPLRTCRRSPARSLANRPATSCRPATAKPRSSQ